MKSIPIALKTHGASGSTTLATCWKATLADGPDRANPYVGGTIVAATSHDRDIVFGGVTYVATNAYNPTDVESTQDLNPDNLEVEGFLAAPSITDADIHSGRWDFAAIEIFEVNYRDLTMGRHVIRSGTLGEVRGGRSKFTAELRGMMQALTRRIGRLTTKECLADLGDSRCKVNLTAFTVHGVVSAIESNRIITDTSRTEAADWFTGGKLTFTSGFNNGLSMEVKRSAIGEVELQQALYQPIMAGDTYSMYAGCQKRLSDCKAKFNNVVNFYGFPSVPGNKIYRSGMVDYADADAGVIGGGSSEADPPEGDQSGTGGSPAGDDLRPVVEEVVRQADAPVIFTLPNPSTVEYTYTKADGTIGRREQVTTLTQRTVNANRIDWRAAADFVTLPEQSYGWGAIAYSPTLDMYAVGAMGAGTGGLIRTSQDLLTWDRPVVPGRSVHRIIWDGASERFIAYALVDSVGGAIIGGQRVRYSIVYSYDGVSWIEHIGAPDEWFHEVIYVETLGKFISASADKVGVSTNGVDWTFSDVPTTLLYSDFRSVAWSESLGLLVMVNALPLDSYEGSAGTAQVITSPDGINWTARTCPPGGNFNSVTWSETLGLFVTGGGASWAVRQAPAKPLMVSEDGINWEMLTGFNGIRGNANTQWIESIDMFVSAALTAETEPVFYGIDLPYDSDRRVDIFTSPDGYTWTVQVGPDWWQALLLAHDASTFVRLIEQGVDMTGGFLGEPMTSYWVTSTREINEL